MGAHTVLCSVVAGNTFGGAGLGGPERDIVELLSLLPWSLASSDVRLLSPLLALVSSSTRMFCRVECERNGAVRRAQNGRGVPCAPNRLRPTAHHAVNLALGLTP